MSRISAYKNGILFEMRDELVFVEPCGPDFILVLLLFTVIIFSAWAERSVPDTMRDITTMDLVRDMGIGINLGNTLLSVLESP